MKPSWELTLGKHQLAVLRRGMAFAGRLGARTVRVGPHALATLDRGRGEPFVMVHGFGGDKETWLLMAPWLPRHLRTIAFDLPGHGASSGAGDTSPRAQSEVLARFLDAIGVERAILCGNSMGGGISLRFARDYPDRVRALVLVASAAPIAFENELTRSLARGENLLAPDDPSRADDFLRTVTERPPKVPRAVQRWVAADRIRRKPDLDRIFAGWIGATGADGMPEDLEAIAAPALIVHGARDRIIPPEIAEQLAARLPRAERVILHGVGHVPQLEAPRDVARLVARFVAGL